MALLLCLVFFLSGAAALLFETLWFHQLGLVLGNTVWASSLVLAGFMGGLALGNALAARFGHRVRRRVRLYACLEVSIGVAGLALVHALPLLAPLLAPLLRPFLELPWILNPLRWATALALLVVPSTAMGATLPLLVAALSRRDPSFGRVLGRLYGWNTLGAVAGALSGHGFLIGWLGIRGAGGCAALASSAAGLLAWGLARRLDAPDGAARAPDPTPLPASGWRLLAAAALCGAILLALEVVWFRFLLLFVLGSSLAFALMLALVLAGIGFGGLAAGAWLARDAEPTRRLPWIALAGGALCVAGYALFEVFVGPLAADAIHRPLDIVRVGAPLMFPVSFLSGVLFTGLGNALQRRAPAATRSVGLVTLANTGGAALGALIGGFLLLPLLGIERSLQLLALGYGAAALAIAVGTRPQRLQRAALGAGLLLLVTAVLATSGLMRQRYVEIPARRFAEAEGTSLVAVREGLTETILFLSRESYGETLYQRLVTNAHSMSSSDLFSRRYMKSFVYLPVALHPRPRRALLISYGLGLTAKALTDTRELERIDVVDVSREILDLDHLVYPEPAERPLGDPRVRLHLEDGRFFLQSTDRHWDLITGEPPPPKAAGIVNLFSVEFFELVRERLAEGGIASYWLPVHSLFEAEAKAVIAAFCRVFEDCSLWSGWDMDWMLVGTRGARGPRSVAELARQWRDPAVAGELADLGLEVPEQLGALFLADAAGLRERIRDTPPLDDDHPARIGREPTHPQRQRRIYRRWMRPARTRPAFARSAFVGALWPRALREASLDYFRFQPWVEGHVDGRFDSASVLQRVHRLQTTSELRTLVQWQLNSSADSLEAALRAASRGRRGPGLSYERGARALAERDFLTAAREFSAVREQGRRRRRALHYRLYALCMAGRLEEARGLAAETGVSAARRPGDREAWRFLDETFSLDGEHQE